MAHLKTFEAGHGEKFKISVDVNGEFYANVPEYLADAFERVWPSRAAGCVRVDSRDLKDLERELVAAVAAFNKPEITRENVILYNIESHASFAEDEDGNIHPNAGPERFSWPQYDRKRELYGNHHACAPAVGGYSLKVGARALTKKTIKYRKGKSKVEYDAYYGQGGDHFGYTNPAEKLNSWCAMHVGENAKEIPYSDKAALFFHDLIMGMARLSQLIQESTFDQADLLSLIENDGRLLAAPKREGVE